MSSTKARKERGKRQKIFLIDYDLTSPSTGDYSVAGTTGNVYTVKIQSKPTCSCPDHRVRRNRCKHIFFILIRILGVTAAEEDLAEYTAEQLTAMFVNRNRRIDGLMVGKQVREIYQEKKKKPSKKGDDGKVARKSLDDVCPVCLDDLSDGEPLIYCEYSCGKPIHHQCLKMWTQVQAGPTAPLKCLTCHQSMSKPVTLEKYFNLYEHAPELPKAKPRRRVIDRYCEI